MTSSVIKLCLFCKFFRLDGGSPTYSALTIGDAATIQCIKNNWQQGKRTGGEINLQRYGFDEKQFRDVINHAEICIDYLPVAEEKK